MRDLAARLLALPVIAVVVLVVLVRRPAARFGAALAAGGILGLGVLSLVPAPTTVATPPSITRTLPTAEFQVRVAVGHALREPVAIEFASTMDPATVAEALRVQPPTAVHLTWNDAATKLTVTPVEHWQAGVVHTVTVAPTATDVAGARLARPLRAIFLTRDTTAGAISATRMAGERARLDTAFSIAFDRPIDVASAAAALRVDPPVPGRVLPAGDGEPTGLVFRPSESLRPGTLYRVSVDELTADADGARLEPVPALSVRTVDAPAVVRFRPRAGAETVERDAAISVRFTEPMDRRATGRAFAVAIGDDRVDGIVRWAERDTVLVFTPNKPLPYGATVTVRIGTAAASVLGAPLATDAAGSFTVEPKPAPRPVVQPVTAPTRTGSTGAGSGGGSVAAGTWAAVERYYLGLMNCTRTGGWVTSAGQCSSPGGRSVAPLHLDAGISTKVARPYARLLATRGLCSHFVGGNPGDRLRRAGYTSYRWAENIGCRSGSPSASVLGTHLFYQSERPYNGGHYRNLMDPRFDRVGIGVWVSSGRVRLVVDFYHP